MPISTTPDAELAQRAVAFMKQEMAITSGHDLMHIERVRNHARNIARIEGGDLLVIDLAAILHDLVNLPKNHPQRKEASTLSAPKAAAWLKDQLEPARIERVYDAIRCHSFSAGFTPQYLEGKIVSDADSLDGLGAIGIARVFETGGSLGTATFSPHDPFCKNRTPDDKQFTVDHFYTKLLLLKDRFHTPEGKRLAEDRTAYMQDFLARLQQEIELEHTSLDGVY